MSIKVEDMGPLAYGGVVTLTNWLDQGRIDRGELTDKDIMKKFETYGYLVPGGIATVASAMGAMRRWENWLEPIQHGFIYDFPRFLMGVVNAMRTTGGAKSAAVKEAQRILNQSGARQLGAGNRAERSYQPEFNKVVAF